MRYRATVITISDKGSRGEREDTSGPLLRSILEKTYDMSEVLIVPDEIEIIAQAIQREVDEKGIDLVVTTGGTGVSVRDVTPEATRMVIERDLPGFGEIMRAESYKITPFALISRALCGIRRGSIVINLPGSPKAAAECLSFVVDAIPHALGKIKGDMEDCAR